MSESEDSIIKQMYYVPLGSFGGVLKFGKVLFKFNKTICAVFLLQKFIPIMFFNLSSSCLL